MYKLRIGGPPYGYPDEALGEASSIKEAREVAKRHLATLDQYVLVENDGTIGDGITPVCAICLNEVRPLAVYYPWDLPE